MTTNARKVPIIFDIDVMVGWFISTGVQPTEEVINEAAAILGRDHYPDLVSTLHCELGLDRETLQKVVPAAWLMAEFPASSIPEDDWIFLFEDAGLTKDGESTSRPSEPVHLYRGADALNAYGWSWTPDREQALWFRNRFNLNNDRHLWETWADPNAILAIITGEGGFGRTGESEYVLNPEHLTDVRQVEL